MVKLLLIVATLFFGGCKEVSEITPIRFVFFRFTTQITFIIYPQGATTYPEEALQSIQNRLDSLFKVWEVEFSPRGENSQIFAINNRDSDTLIVSQEMRHLLQRIADLDIRGFDPTIEPLFSYWDISERGSNPPSWKETASSDTLSKLTKSRGFYEEIRLNGDTLIFSNSELTINLGGSAKGRVLDLADSLITEAGFTNWLISAGGDMVTRGGRNSSTPFTIGVAAPRESLPSYRFQIYSGAVLTSGDYERYRLDRDGVKIHHIIDPKTGFPATENMSLTIIGDGAEIVDIYTTGLFSLPADSIISFIDEKEGFEALIINSKGEMFKTKGFPKLL